MEKDKMKKILSRFGLYFAWFIAMIATFGSLFASQILNYEPCVLCWYQRIMMFPLVIILGMAAFKNDKYIVSYVITLPIFGAIIAFVQTLYSYFDFSTSFCGSQCSESAVKLFGVIDFSIASFFSFLSISFFLFFSKKKI
jgi:disulfide bond formation protein DsbB